MSMNTEYIWRVYKLNKFIGYVVSFSALDAMRKANDQFGSYILIERII